ncbi:MAG: RluA family pseudouridine synthase [Anaerovoracaceae bacterium]
MSQFNYTVTSEDKGMSIKILLGKKFSFSTRLRNKIKREKLVFVNGEQLVTYLIPNPGDVITVNLPEESSNFTPEDIPVSIVYEDEGLLIVDKQPGLVVHPTKGHPCHTLANGIMKYMLDNGDNYKIRFINRLDMDTSGIVLVAKNSHGQASFMKQNQENKVKKIYIAVVTGIIAENEGTIDCPIGQPDPDSVRRGVVEGGSPSITHYTVLKRYDSGYTLVELGLETGRTHQIRVHLSHIGYPIVGDHLYGQSNAFLIERQALHAKSISLSHPVTGLPLAAEAPLPEDILKLIEKIK